MSGRQATPRSGTSQGSTRQYDPRQRQEAARLQHGHPAWLVLYGPHSRQFWSFPAFDAQPGTIVTAATPTDLVVLMRQAEISAGARLPPATPPAPAPRERHHHDLIQHPPARTGPGTPPGHRPEPGRPGPVHPSPGL